MRCLAGTGPKRLRYVVKAAHPQEHPDHMGRRCDRTETQRQGPLNAENCLRLLGFEVVCVRVDREVLVLTMNVWRDLTARVDAEVLVCISK